MFINPRYAIEQGWITWNDKIDDIDKYVQPNAIDFDCTALYEINDEGVAFLSETQKVMRSVTPVPLILTDTNHHGWVLEEHKCYDFMSNFYVELPENVAAELIIRSTLNRNGIFLTSGLYDSGFKGQIAGVLHNRSGQFLLAPNTRIGQIKFIDCSSSHLYSGGYNTEQNQHWTEKS